MRCLSEEALRRHVSFAAAIESQQAAFVALQRGEVAVPERIVCATAGGPTLFKPFVTDAVMGLKVVSVRGGGVPAVTLLCDTHTGLPTALMNATYLTALRTAAGSALACRLLCEDKTGLTMTVFGAGLQAEMHARVMSTVRRFNRVVIVNRTVEKAELLAKKLRDVLENGVAVESVALGDSESVNSCVANSQCIVTATDAKCALFDGSFVRCGTFFAAVGSYSLTMRELDDVVIRRSTIVADDPAEVLRTSGDFISQPPIACSLGQLLLSSQQPQQEERKKFDGADIKLFKSIGCSVQDLFIARAALSLVPEEAASVIEL